MTADGDAIVGLCNGEPKTVVDAIEAGAGQITSLRLHQMLPLRDRPYIEGVVAGLRHVSWFLSPHDTRGSSPASTPAPPSPPSRTSSTKVGTEYGVAELRGSTTAERTAA